MALIELLVKASMVPRLALIPVPVVTDSAGPVFAPMSVEHSPITAPLLPVIPFENPSDDLLH